MPLPDPIIIALTGPKGAGKDTVADYLVAVHGYMRLAFADAMRQEVSTAFNVPLQTLTERETKEHPMSALALNRCWDSGFVRAMQQRFEGTHLDTPRSPRQIMQWWATEYRREQQPDYWLQRLMATLHKEHGPGQYRFAVTDLRFPNEAALLRDLSATVWQVKRPGYEPQLGEHSSETTGAEFRPEFTLLNTRDIAHLHKQAEAAMRRMDASTPRAMVRTESDPA